jgi:hypothetical protein
MRASLSRTLCWRARGLDVTRRYGQGRQEREEVAQDGCRTIMFNVIRSIQDVSFTSQSVIVVFRSPHGLQPKLECISCRNTFDSEPASA